MISAAHKNCLLLNKTGWNRDTETPMELLGWTYAVARIQELQGGGDGDKLRPHHQQNLSMKQAKL